MDGGVAVKRCRRCQEDLPESSFARNRSSKDGLQAWCRACRTLSARKPGAREIKLYASPAELAYLAGVIDSDGCISTMRSGDGSVAAKLLVTNTNPKLADWLTARFGGNTSWRQLKAQWKPCFNWRVTHRRAEILIDAVSDYLVLKQDQALAVCGIGALRLLNQEDRGGRQISKWRPLTDEERAAYDFIHEWVRRLNARGSVDSGAEQFLLDAAAGV